MINVLFSGGMDSWACLNWAIINFRQENVLPVYYDFGQRCAKREIAAGSKLCESIGLKLNVLSVPHSILHEDLDTGHVPLRNLMFILLTASYYETSEGIVFGMLKGESSEDKNPKFVRYVQRLLDTQFVTTAYRAEKKRFKIYTPFGDKTKVQTVAWLKENVSGYQLFNTVACYSELGDCGHCASCIGRWVAFESNKLFLDYKVVHPFDTLVGFVKGDVMFPLNERKQPLSSIPKRIYRLWEVFNAADQYCMRKYGFRITKYIRNNDLKRPIWARLKNQIVGGK